jgi:hypothetical protein
VRFPREEAIMRGNPATKKISSKQPNTPTTTAMKISSTHPSNHSSTHVLGTVFEFSLEPYGLELDSGFPGGGYGAGGVAVAR